MWWSTLESGLALIAACLPSLSNIFANVKLDQLVKNMRRTISLQGLRESWAVSGGSRGSRASKNVRGSHPSDLEKNSPSSSQSGLTEKPSTIGARSNEHSRPSNVGQAR